MGLILCVGFTTKVFRLETPSQFYFDEVYHAFTATRYLHGDKDAYNPWAKPPAGVAFEWTHPPLAKLAMAGNMQIFGETPFGWRIGSVLCSTLAIGLTAALSLELFASYWIAGAAAFLMSVEGLTFVQGRIAMNDSYFLCFMLLALLFYLRWWKNPSRLSPLLISAIALGLAVATKWTAIYVFLIIGTDSIRRCLHRETRPQPVLLLRAAAIYTLIPITLYILSYGQFFYLGGTWTEWSELQKQMWYYHSRLTATHGYQSKPYQWILNLRPVWMHVIYPSDSVVANIYNIGNGIVLWTGLVAVCFGWMRKSKNLVSYSFVLICYFMLWLPWSFSPRIMLFYHYLPAIPFLCILLAHFLEPYRQTRAVVLSLALLWFIIFFPHMTAITVPKSFAQSVYFALPGWR